MYIHRWGVVADDSKSKYALYESSDGNARGESVFVASVCWHLCIIRSTSFILSNSHDDGLKETRTTNMATEANI